MGQSHFTLSFACTSLIWAIAAPAARNASAAMIATRLPLEPKILRVKCFPFGFAKLRFIEFSWVGRLRTTPRKKIKSDVVQTPNIGLAAIPFSVLFP